MIVEDDKGTSSTYVSIVPEGDRDCDGVTGAAECSANVYQFAAPPPGDLKQSTCMLRAPTASGVACRLGGGCVDGGARCEPTHACIPDPFCDCGLDDLACLLQTAATPGFRIDCTVPTNNGQLCESPSDTLRIYVPPFMQTATECGNIRFNRLPRPGQPLVPPLFDPQSSLQFDDGARVDLNDNLGAGCNFTLKTVSVPPLTNGTPARDHALTILEASNGFTVVVPLDLTFVSQGCGMTSTNCVFLGPDAMNVNADSMWNCLRVPPP